MATTACTSTIYTYVIPASSTGGTATITPPKPIWSDATGVDDLQCGAVTLGGFNGLNN